MKILKGLLPLLLPALLLCSCGGTATTDGTSVKGRVTLEGYEGRQVYLETPDGTRADSARVEDGRFAFAIDDSLPAVYDLVLRASDDDIFPITLPVVSEKGTVSVSLGEYVLTTGTPLNDVMQDFLLAVSTLSDKQTEGEFDAEKYRADFASLVEGHALTNIGNAVGRYIYGKYASKLTPEQCGRIERKAEQTSNH